MSKYTTEVRFICESYNNFTDSKGFDDVETIIKNALPKIFNFNFPIFDEKYRNVLETKIIRHFYTREIGFETVGLWKLKLDTKLNEIMPFYNQLYRSELLEINPLYTTDITRTHSNKINNESKNNESTASTIGTKENDSYNTKSITTGTTHDKTEGKLSNTTTGTGSGSNSSTSYNLYSDTPQGTLSHVNQENYLTNATKDTESATSSSNTKNISSSTNELKSDNSHTDDVTGSGASKKDITTENNAEKEINGSYKTTEEYLESVKGYSGYDASKLLMNYRETFLNIDLLVINELEDLFFQLW